MKASRRCTAHRKNGARCQLAAIHGGTVCHKHGGSAPQVKRKARQRIEETVERLVQPARLLREAARLAYSDLGLLLDEDGHFLPVKQWPAWARAAVAGVEWTKRNLTAGDGVQEDVVKVKLWDKPKNIEILMKHLGMLIEHHKVGVDEDLLAWLDTVKRQNR